MRLEGCFSPEVDWFFLRFFLLSAPIFGERFRVFQYGGVLKDLRDPQPTWIVQRMGDS